MKIIAITEKYSYDNDPKRLLVDISADELDQLVGTRSTSRERCDRYQIGKTIHVGKIWATMEVFRQVFNGKQKMINSLRSHLDEFEKVDLPELIE